MIGVINGAAGHYHRSRSGELKQAPIRHFSATGLYPEYYALCSDSDLTQEWLKDAARGRSMADIPCPLCSSKFRKSSKPTLRIWDKGDYFTFYCARCEASGGGRDGNSKPRERSFAERIADKKKDAERREAEKRERQAKIDKANRYWNEATPIAGTPGENWLASRGIDINRVPDHGQLRWHPACPLASVVSRYTHVLTAEAQGIRRRPVDGANAEFLGPSKSAVVRLWPVVGEHLCIAEGVETALFAATGVKLYGKLLQPMWACLSAGNLEVLPVLPGVKVLTIIVDNDKNGTGQSKARKCAERWQEAGRSVMLVTPRKTGFDLNDFHVGHIAPPIEISDLVDLEMLEPKLQGGRAAKSAHAAREQFEQLLLDIIAGWRGKRDPPPVSCVKMTTGGGKTRMVARAVARDILYRKSLGQETKPLLYCVPTHRLGEEIAELFRREGLTAVVIRGRTAINPNERKPMCSWLEQVKLAVEAGLNVEESCCKSKHEECPFYKQCAYQNQFSQRTDVIIVAHQTLFHANEKIKEFSAVVIDEDFHDAGIFISRNPIPIAHIEHEAYPPKNIDISAVSEHRRKLAELLKQQKKNGGLRREHLTSITAEDCTKAIKAEWEVINKCTSGISPGMKNSEIMALRANNLPWVKHAHSINGIWYAVRSLIENEDIIASGRVAIDVDKQTVKLRGIKDIAKQWRVPTLIMSATLPSLGILRFFY